MLVLFQFIHVLAGVFTLAMLATFLIFCLCGLRWPKEMVKERPWYMKRL